MSNNHNLPAVPANDGWDGAAQEAAERTIRGRLLKFVDRIYYAGKERTPVADGTKLVVTSTRAAWVCWEGGKKVEERERKPEQRLPDREDLDRDDQGLWERGTDGRPIDPWQNTRYLYLVDPFTAETFTFETHSFGGRDAVLALGDQTARMRTVHPRAMPVVELRSAPYPTKYGMKSKPQFKVVDWKGLNSEGEPAERQITLQKAKQEIDNAEMNDEVPF